MTPAALVVAPDKFKGSLSAAAAADAMAAGCRDALPDCRVTAVPVADGGDGTVDVLRRAGARLVRRTVTGPLGADVEAEFAVLGDTAYLETAQACGLRHVPAPGPATARTATTYGVGQLVAAALELGHRRIVLGLGGSATTDGGAGMAVALGARLLDADGRDLPPGGAALSGLAAVDLNGLDARLRDVEVVLACDVDNPLSGPLGAAAVFASQKGADRDSVAELDAALTRFGVRLAAVLGADVAGRPGAGAAGGLGAGTMAFLGARATSGIDLLLELLGLPGTVRGADLVLIGEGRLDDQTFAGKAPVGVARLAGSLGVDVVAVAGQVAARPEALHAAGIQAAHSLTERAESMDDAVRRAAELLRVTAAVAVAEWAERRSAAPRD
ncbi:glycerate kinase [Blastococcus saxobsidens]|uniref:Glycerate kinase n=1 Tax=Blastococcus saxobsidens (strain DD2) TaxID=1146883 RepID=H6RKA0_BLASD|nr:glycerate kinase [Blastococcus saxobsidens]CCG01123.1 Glycerate kinase [Blastococcus saxobsidens DD2]